MATAKQISAIDNLVENRGKSIGSAMIEAGYSPKSAKNPINLTASKAWHQLMQKHLSDGKLATLHKKLLEKEEVIVVSDGAREGSHIEWTGQPHSDAVKALDIAYKIKSKFPKEEDSGNRTLIVVVSNEIAQRYAIETSQNPS